MQVAERCGSIMIISLAVLLATSLFGIVRPDDISSQRKQPQLRTPKKDELDSMKLPPCAACSSLVSSFEAGIEFTSRGKFEGGDTAWEEQNQGHGYATSEVRFVEIQERLCQGVERAEHQCHSNHHEWEELLEQWWSLSPSERPELKVWLCIEQLKVCCPDDRFGPKCESCSVTGTNGKICSGNGKCKGAGTRKGNGQCACDKGYSGDRCDRCSDKFYEAYRDQDKLLCSACHRSCLGHCTGSGPKSCLACSPGYRMDVEHGCLDVDECHVSSAASQPCSSDSFCVNNEGSFACIKCDKACKSCHADGPDSCDECATGYSRNKDNFCISDKSAGKIFNLSNTRYFTYIGLCVATAIIFQRSAVTAGVLGIIIASYVTFSEYYLQGASGELKPISKD